MRRLFSPTGACLAFILVSALILSGLGWVTVASLQVETAQREASLRADRATQERLALWRMDGLFLPVFGVETNRPYAHYSALHNVFPAVDADFNNDMQMMGNFRLPSPLLSADLPAWMALHFQIDAETGWESPQVLPGELAEKLAASNWLSLQNVTPQRQVLLAELMAKCNKEEALAQLNDHERRFGEDSLFLIPAPLPAEPSTPKSGDATGNGTSRDRFGLSNEELRRKASNLAYFKTSDSYFCQGGYAREMIPTDGAELSQRFAAMGRGGRTTLEDIPTPPIPPLANLGGQGLNLQFGQNPGTGSGGANPAPQIAGLGGIGGGRTIGGQAAALPTNPSNSVAQNSDYDKRDQITRQANRSAVENIPSPRGGTGNIGNEKMNVTTGNPGLPNNMPAPTTAPLPVASAGGPSSASPAPGMIPAPAPASAPVPAIGGVALPQPAGLAKSPSAPETAPGTPKLVPQNAIRTPGAPGGATPPASKPLDNVAVKPKTELPAKAEVPPADKVAEGKPGLNGSSDLKKEAEHKSIKDSPGETKPRMAKALESAEKGASRKESSPSERPVPETLMEKQKKLENGDDNLKTPMFDAKKGEPGKLNEHQLAKKQEDEALEATKRRGVPHPWAFFAAERKAAPSPQPMAVHVGPLRSQWLAGSDGTHYLVLVRAARLEQKTVYQGIVLDWVVVQERLKDLLHDLFPTAKFTRVLPDQPNNPERAMTILPVQLDPGPTPELPPAGLTPLRLGLILAWVAAIIALLAVGFGGRALLDLSERRIRFVSAVTHELRTPLTSLRLYLDLLTSGMIEDPDKQKEYLNTLANESERLNRLIENVLDFARLEKRSVQAHRQAVPITELLNQVEADWKSRCEADGRELVSISTVPTDQTVMTDLRMAAQILGNLIDNSRKYSRDSADPRIWVWVKPGERGQIVLEVEDRGPGVSPRERSTIFRPFQRGQEADTTAGGAGLGLALAKQWAEMLGGSLSYRTPEGGVGACFRLELPSKG